MKIREQDLPRGPATVFRRLAALVYDGLLLLAVLFLGTLVLLPFTGGESITPQDSGAWAYAYRGWVALLTLGFFGVSWTRRGQTLGMMSWKIRLVRLDGSAFRWIHVLSRLGVGMALVVAAALGLWLLQDGARDSLDAVHDTAIRALAEAAAAAGVTRFVQVSAAGVAPEAATGFLRSKARGDTPSNPLYTWDVRAGDLLSELLNITKVRKLREAHAYSGGGNVATAMRENTLIGD